MSKNLSEIKMERSQTHSPTFRTLEITLPEEDLRKAKWIHPEAGWLIQYCFGKDDNGEYLDYYAAHRMTEDCHVRIYQDGQVEQLPALYGIRIVKKDPEEDKRLEEEYYRHNREVTRMLARKGFTKFTINMFLHAGLDKKDKI